MGAFHSALDEGAVAGDEKLARSIDAEKTDQLSQRQTE
jgi:hypothetical protein